jgi:hypothetical protein
MYRKIMVDLKVQPTLRCGTQCLRQQPRRFGGNPTLTPHNFVSMLDRQADPLGQRTLHVSERIEKLLS